MTNRIGTDSQARAKRAAIYRKAARMIESGPSYPSWSTEPWQRFSCCAVAKAAGARAYKKWNVESNRGIPETRDYVAMYAENDVHLQGWIQRSGDPRGVRVLLLCFAAAITERP